MKKTYSEIQASETLQSFLRNAKKTPNKTLVLSSKYQWWMRRGWHVLYWTRERRNWIVCFLLIKHSFNWLLFISPLVIQYLFFVRIKFILSLCGFFRHRPLSSLSLFGLLVHSRVSFVVFALICLALYSHRQVLGLQRRGRPGPGSAPDGDGRRRAAPGRHGVGCHQPTRHDR